MTTPTSDTPTSTTPVVHLPSMRLIWRGRGDDPASGTVLALCDEIERLRRELDSATTAAEYHQRDAKALRDERYQRQVAVTRALRAVSDAMHGRTS